MGRKRIPCEWCEDNFSTDSIEHRNGYCLWAEVYPFAQMITVFAQANDENGETTEDFVTIPMNFCPNCGRKLT